ncbi:MAG: hypothetical protein GY738_25295, partial [Pseudoalteromonas sp.]|nr:hypothetical protein [Pseudoalteromonas sp.]
PPARILKVKELLEAAELAAARESVTDFVAALLRIGISQPGLERSFEAAKRLYAQGLKIGHPGVVHPSLRSALHPAGTLSSEKPRHER